MKEMEGKEPFESLCSMQISQMSGQWDTKIDGLLVIFIYLSIKQNLPCKHVYSGILFGGACLSSGCMLAVIVLSVSAASARQLLTTC